MLRTLASLSTMSIACRSWPRRGAADAASTGTRQRRLDAVALWEPQYKKPSCNRERCDRVLLPGVYTEKFNLCTTQANLETRVARAYRDLCAGVDHAAQRLQQDLKWVGDWSRRPRTRYDTGACVAHLNYPARWRRFTRCFDRQEAWIAKGQGAHRARAKRCKAHRRQRVAGSLASK